MDNGFGGAESYDASPDKLKLSDFLFEERTITFPELFPPSSVLQKAVPDEALQEAERVKRLLGCSSSEIAAPLNACTGKLVFAFNGKSDPYWFVLRTCSSACELNGDSIEELTRGDSAWEVTSRGFINSPKAEVERLKRQIEKAEMFQIGL